MGLLTLKSDKDVWVGVVGTAASGTLNTFIEVKATSDLTQFGAFGTGTLVNALTILLRYGIKAMVIRVATGVDAPTTAANIVGTDLTNGLGLMSTLESALGRWPICIIAPGISDNTVVTALNQRAGEMGTLAIADYVGTLANLNTARAGSTNYGLKSKNLAITFPNLLNGATTEFLSVHTAALLARAYKFASYGIAPAGETLLNVTGITPSLSMPTDGNTLAAAGVMTVNSLGNSLYSLRGYSNSLVPSDTSQDSLLVRMIVEGVITRKVKAYLQSKLGISVNVQSARLIEMELSNLISNEVFNGNIRYGYAKFNELNSSFPVNGSATLAYDICVTLISGVASVVTITFTVVS